MKVEKYKDIKSTQDAKGYTIYTTVTFEDGTKSRLRKRVKETDLNATKRFWLEMLNNGLNPLDIDAQKKLLKVSGLITVADALQDFYLSRRVTPKTLIDYKIHLSVFEKKYSNINIKSITNKNIEDLLKEKLDAGDYAQSTLTQAKKTFTTFFNFCTAEKIISSSPLNISKSLKSIKDTKDKHVPFSESDFVKILEELKKDEHRLIFNFINFIYTIHLRPKEIRFLKKQDIDLEKNVITVKASVAKNSKKEILPIYPSLRKVIDSMNLNELNDDDFIFSFPFKNGKRTKIGVNYASDYFRNKILIPLDMHEKTGYTLYSFKAKGNLDKLDKHGWSLPQLQRCNRHSNIAQTLTYLKNIGKITEIDNLEITDL